MTAETMSQQVDSDQVNRAVHALLKYHEKTSGQDLLGNDRPLQVQFTLFRAPGSGSPKPIRVSIPHPLFQLSTEDNDDDGLDEPEVCLIVKEESKPWVQSMIEKFPDHMGCIKKVLGLQSLRKKHAQYQQRRELLHKYNLFMADDRILPMLSKALGKDFYKHKKLPIPISITRKEALPLAIQSTLKATFLTLSQGTCLNVRAGHTGMSPEKIIENIVAVSKNAIPKMPRKWDNIQNISIKTPESVSLPIYNRTPESLMELTGSSSTTTKATESINKKSKQQQHDEKQKRKRELAAAKSPLVRALKKQKQTEEKKNKGKEIENKQESSSEKKRQKKMKSLEEEEDKDDDDVEEKDNNKQSPKMKKKKIIITPEKQKTTTTIKSSSEKSSEKKKKMKKSKDDNVDDNDDKKEENNNGPFIASKKYKGSKKGYVFRMGPNGLGYYIDVKPKVDKMALEAMARSIQNKKRRGGQKKNRYKGTRRF